MFDFSKLTEFNAAIIYNFEPEAPPASLDNAPLRIEDTLFPKCRQYQELFEAYLYVQNEILPGVRAAAESIDTEQFLTYIKKTHTIMCKSLVKMLDPEALSGEYISNSVSRWNAGYMISMEFVGYFNESRSSSYKKSFIAHLVAQYGVDPEEISNFIILVDKIKSKREFNLTHTQELNLLNTPLERQFIAGMRSLKKVELAYHSESLSLEQKNTIKKVVIFCMPPEKISAAMSAYAEKTLAKFKTCNKDDLDEITAFLADLFYGLTDIHPFTNGNGRVATCMMNMFLRLFNRPSILLRLPGEKENASSLYSRTMNQMSDSRELLQLLIKTRIAEAERTSFSNPAIRQKISYQINSFEVIQRIISNHESFKAASLMPLFLSKIPKKDHYRPRGISSFFISSEEWELSLSKKFYDFCCEVERCLDDPSRQFSLVIPGMDDAQIGKLVCCLVAAIAATSVVAASCLM
jgi:prophage maintenance system killer protein